ncbi:MAG: OmpA family protein [Methylocystis sp.]|nr:OmpA family protein [Methylocystis sp.]
MPTPGGAEAFEQLKALLIGDMAARVQKLDARLGDDQKLGEASGDVLIEAITRAESTRGRELSAALAPAVVSAIRSEIKNSKEMMVEALYPITGRLVTAAVANAFRDLVETMNARIDALVSANSWRLRLRALATGKTMAEVALAESEAGRLKRALLLERGSGRVLAIWPESGAETENADLASGMIAAITEFASNVYADRGGELRMLDLGASEVFLRASPRVIVAAEFGGDLTRQRQRRLDEVFLDIVERHEKDEADCTSEALGAMLSDVLADAPAKPASKKPLIVAALVVAALAAWASWGPVTRSLRESRISAAFSRALAGHQRLAQFPLQLDFDHEGGRVVLRGLAANNEEPQALVDAIAADAKPYRVEQEISVVALAAQAEALKAGETRAAATLQEAQQQIDALRAELNEVREALLREGPREKLRRFISDFAVFFTEQDNIVDAEATNAKLDQLAELLKTADIGLRVVGYADETGSATLNRALSRRRADKIADLLAQRGVKRERLALVPRSTLYPIADTGPDAARSRRVSFEIPYVGEFDVR